VSPFLPQGHDQAERAFLEGRHGEAITLWKEALADPNCAQRGAIEFNVGLACARMGQPAEALWHFRCAERLLPEHAAVSEQCARMEADLGQPRLDTALGSAASAWLLLALAVLLSSATCFALLRSKLRGAIRWIVFGLGALLAFSCASWLLKDSAERQLGAAIVLHPCPVLSEPGTGGNRLQQLKPGASLGVLAISDRWVEVSGPEWTGFVERQHLGLVR
jgi:hypothetical protein